MMANNKKPILFFSGTDIAFGIELSKIKKAVLVNCAQKPDIEEIQKMLKDTEDVIFACPEWNGSYPWFFKKVIDNLAYKSFKDKSMRMIVWSGGHNKAENLRMSLVHLAHFLQMNIKAKFEYIKR